MVLVGDDPGMVVVVVAVPMLQVGGAANGPQTPSSNGSGAPELHTRPTSRLPAVGSIKLQANATSAASRGAPLTVAPR